MGFEAGASSVQLAAIRAETKGTTESYYALANAINRAQIAASQNSLKDLADADTEKLKTEGVTVQGVINR